MFGPVTVGLKEKTEPSTRCEGYKTQDLDNLAS